MFAPAKPLELVLFYGRVQLVRTVQDGVGWSLVTGHPLELLHPSFLWVEGGLVGPPVRSLRALLAQQQVVLFYHSLHVSNAPEFLRPQVQTGLEKLVGGVVEAPVDRQLGHSDEVIG